MVEIKLETDEIVFRLLYLGVDDVTADRSLRDLHRGLGGTVDRLVTLHAGGDRITSFRHRVPEAEPIFGLQVHMQPFSISSQALTPANVELLVRNSDAVVIVADGVAPAAVQAPGMSGLSQLLDHDVPILLAGPKVGDQTELAGRGRIEMTSTMAAFTAAREHLLKRFRLYEQQLRNRGLENHVMIRDRVYEKVDLASSSRDVEIDEPITPVAIDPEIDRWLREPLRAPRERALWFLVFALAVGAAAVSLLV